MVLMHFVGAPAGDLVESAVPGKQGVALLVLEDHQRFLAGGAGNAHSRHLQAPLGRSGPHVGEVVEIGPLEETLPGVGHFTLHLGLVLGVASPGWVWDEASVLGVLQKPYGEVGMQRVGSYHRCREIVDDQVLRHPAEGSPRRLQAGDHVLQLLPLHGPDEAVPRMTQHDDDGPHRLALARGRVGDHAQPAEVSLGHLPRLRVLHPHRRLASLAPIPLQHKSPQRLVRQLTSLRCQQFMDARHLQPVIGNPAVDLVRPRLQHIFGGCLRLTGTHLANGRQAAQLVLSRNWSVPSDAFLLRRRQVLAHRIPRQPSACRNLPLTVSRLPAAYDFSYFHSGDLPVRHRCTSKMKCGDGRPSASQSGLMTL